MALALRYQREFYSLDAVIWRIEIFQEGFAGQAAVIDVADESPLVIEWPETGKMDPIQASSATVRLISGSDGQFLDLYTVRAGDVRLDVYRNGSLYWSGCMDTELYEEPYTSKDGYVVSLTFADFGILERYDWQQTGRMTILALIQHCLSLTGISYTSLETHISTARYSDIIDLSDYFIVNDNFYDEDGEASGARTVLESVLQPFALRLVQKAGRLWLYDLNAMAAMTAVDVSWCAADSRLSVDRVYNNVKVSFSPYGNSKLMEGTVERDDDLEDASGEIFYKDYDQDENRQPLSPEGFRIHHNRNLPSNLQLAAGVDFFQITPIYSGNNDTGVIASLRSGLWPQPASIIPGLPDYTTQELLEPKDCGTQTGGNVNTGTIITCPRCFLGNTSYERSRYKLRIRLSLLADPRYNPYEDASENNEEVPYNLLKAFGNIAYVPIKLTLQDDSGNALYHYENKAVMDSDGYTGYQGWRSGAAAWGDAYLAYYDANDRANSSGVSGWAVNKPIIGRFKDELPSRLSALGDGEYAPLPPAGGYLVLEIGEGLHFVRTTAGQSYPPSGLRWIAYKQPEIVLCDYYGLEYDVKDIEDSAWLERSARESLKIDTIVGTLPGRLGVPNARGQIYMDLYGGVVVDGLCRAGVSDRLERLLIGTAYSQYASRHAVLSGTVKSVPAFGPLSDSPRMGAMSFIEVSCIERCRLDESEIKMIELSPDNYEGIEYE